MLNADTLTNDEQQERELQEHQPGYYRSLSGRMKKVKPVIGGEKPVRRVPSVLNRVRVGEDTYLAPFGDEVILRVDRFKDEAMCRECGGVGHSKVRCEECKGEAVWWVDARGVRDKRVYTDRNGLSTIPCEVCRCSNFESPFLKPSGFAPCKPCKGTGQAVSSAGIVTAEQYQNAPSTGVILAVGPQCRRVTIGDRVLFDVFAGKEFEFENRKYRVMRETYPLGRLSGGADFHVTHSNYGGGQ